MIIGADFGNFNTKTSENVIFQSKICKDTKLINLRSQDDKNLIVFQKNRVLVGEGEFQTEPNKLDKEMFKLCFLTALARSSEQDTEYQVVMGVPASQYTEKNVQKIKGDLLKDRIYSLEVSGKERVIILQDIEIYNEAAGAWYGMTKEQRNEIGDYDCILVNIGGGNTNIAYFKATNEGRKLFKSTTVMSGTLNLYADIINAVNGEFSINKTLEDAEGILTTGLEIYGEKQDLSFLKSIILDLTDKLFKELNMYPIKTSKVMFSGGGSRVLKGLLKKRLPGCLFQTNYLLSNAYGFKRVGEKLWQNESL